MDADSFLTLNFSAVCVTSALWGIFVLLSIVSATLLVQRNPQLLRRPWRSPFLVASLFLLCSITAHWILLIRRQVEAFILNGKGDGAYEYLSDERRPISIAIVSLTFVTVIVYDVMIIARTWVVWNRATWVVVCPGVVTLGLTACYIGVVYHKARDGRYTSTVDRWVTATYTLNFGNNLYGTVMIAYRILSINKSLKATGMHGADGRRVLSALPIFVESAALYAAWMLFFFAAYRTQSGGNYLASDCLPVVSGISLTLITIRIGLGWAYTAPRGDRDAPSRETTPTLGGRSSLAFAWPHSRGGEEVSVASSTTVPNMAVSAA